MSHALDNGDVDKAFVHLKKCSNMAAKFNKLRVVLISKRSQVRHTTLKKKATTIIRNTCYGSVFEQCQETRRYTSDALRASSSISVDETDWNMSEIFWEHVCLRWKIYIYIIHGIYVFKFALMHLWVDHNMRIKWSQFPELGLSMFVRNCVNDFEDDHFSQICPRLQRGHVQVSGLLELFHILACHSIP